MSPVPCLQVTSSQYCHSGSSVLDGLLVFSRASDEMASPGLCLLLFKNPYARSCFLAGGVGTLGKTNEESFLHLRFFSKANTWKLYYLRIARNMSFLFYCYLNRNSENSTPTCCRYL